MLYVSECWTVDKADKCANIIRSFETIHDMCSVNSVVVVQNSSKNSAITVVFLIYILL